MKLTWGMCRQCERGAIDLHPQGLIGIEPGRLANGEPAEALRHHNQLVVILELSVYLRKLCLSIELGDAEPVALGVA